MSEEFIKPVAYDEIAPRYDVARPVGRRDEGIWVDLASDFIDPNDTVLDLGCGNGRWIIPFAERLNCHGIGADNSLEMLRLAKNNDAHHLVQWSLQDAEYLSFQDNSFDAVWISHLLHLVQDPIAVTKECFRVLRQDGRILLRYTSLEDNLRMPERQFFPGLIGIDTRRIPPKENVTKWLTSAGFNIVSRAVCVQVYDSAIERLEKARMRVESGLTKLMDEQFRDGIEAFAQYVNEKGNETWLLNDNYVFTVGLKVAR
ncbi:class I SAM-dependent methyltransferase [Candidatus Gottesmanbacteria bacterium]|nr:class I SAM-dependent methyltransferase [Candidatus Gottesmanbacteria bacterium]